jgi:CheY-like chemotaxis protein
MNRPVYPAGVLDAVAFAGLRVLLVDEDVHERESIGRLLEAHGANVTIASDTYYALRSFTERTPDFIVADVSSPSVSGLAVVRSVRQLPAALGGHTPAIAITRPTRSRDADETHEAGFQAQLVKPVNAFALVSTVRGLRDQIVSARQLREETRARRSELAERRIWLQERKSRLLEERAHLARTQLSIPSIDADATPSERVEGLYRVPRANRVMESMPVEDAYFLRSMCEPVTLAAGSSLYYLGDRISHVYFPESAVISLLCVLPEGETVELGMVGYDGVVGAAQSSQNLTARLQPLVQLGGHALRMEITVFERELAVVASLGSAIRKCLDELFNQAARVAACNRFHTLEQRLCRWLLSLHDRAESDELSMTHETISHALGVRRAGVTVALGELQRSHAISSARGRITILDREMLERCSCRCYTPVEDE